MKLAGNVDAHHHVVVADLILVRSAVRETLERLVREHAPDVVGSEHEPVIGAGEGGCGSGLHTDNPRVW